jgi:hypothetical protein
VALGAAFLASPAAFAPLSTERLPGFQIDLPRADDRRPERGDYRRGKLSVRDKELFVSVRWKPGTEVGDDDTTGMARSLSAMIGGTVTDVKSDATVWIPGGLPVQTLKARIDGKPFWVTSAICGGREITISTGGTARGITLLHRRVARSLRCQPDPALEKQLGDVPVIVDLPGWRRVMNGPDRIGLSDGRYIFLASILGPKIDGDTFAKMIPAMVGSDMRAGRRQGDDWPVQARADSTTGWLTFRSCPEVNEGLMLMVLVDGKAGDAGTAHQLLGKARCRRPGEAPQQWPDAPAAPQGG